LENCLQGPSQTASRQDIDEAEDREDRAAMKRKKPTRKQIEIQLDRLWSRLIIARDKTCRECNSDKVLQGHHVRSRRHVSTRWFLANGLTLCSRHHFLQKVNPERFHDQIIGIIGQEKYDHLKLISDKIIKYSVADLIELREQLKGMLSIYE
jgi:hypothetical protein